MSDPGYQVMATGPNLRAPHSQGRAFRDAGSPGVFLTRDSIHDGGLLGVLRIMLAAILVGPVMAQEENGGNHQQKGDKEIALSERGALHVYGDTGWTFGLPFEFPTLQTTGPTTPLFAPSFGVGVTASKLFEPFGEVSVYKSRTDTFTQRITGTQVLSSDTSTIGKLSFLGGTRLKFRESKVRPFVEAGAGSLYTHVEDTISSTEQPTTNSILTTWHALVMYGGGLIIFIGRRWGVNAGGDGYYIVKDEPSHNYVRAYVGVFFQTKSSIK